MTSGANVTYVTISVCEQTECGHSLGRVDELSGGVLPVDEGSVGRLVTPACCTEHKCLLFTAR